MSGEFLSPVPITLELFCSHPFVCWIFCLHLFLIRPFFNTQDSSWLTVPINIINFKAKRNENEMHKISVEVVESQGRKYLLTKREIMIWLVDSYAYFIFFNVWSTRTWITRGICQMLTYYKTNFKETCPLRLCAQIIFRAVMPPPLNKNLSNCLIS